MKEGEKAMLGRGGDGRKGRERRGGDGREGREGLAKMISKYSPSQSTLTKHLPTHLEEAGQKNIMRRGRHTSSIR